MGLKSYTEYRCDRCGAEARVEWCIGDDEERDCGWRIVSLREPDTYEADEPAVLVCPACVKRVRVAVAAALQA